ncbi:MAG: ABC transporter substrate-binding protein [Deltaproteobacteria bacterium]|nr:ABC transporter substrate-binding protein [Deltaproteobacteria bacterium]
MVALGCKRVAKQAAPKPAGARLRIITLTPSFTEIVFALGRGGELVGVDQYSDYPPEASQLPRMGSFLTPNVEAITAAAPDVVLLDAVQSDARRALESVGVHAVALPVLTVDDVHAAITMVGRELHAEDAALALNARLEGELAEAAQLAGSGPRPRALLVVDRELGGLASMVVAGPTSYLDDLLTRAGGANVIDDASGGYIRIAPELVVERAPDVILDAVHTDDVAHAVADWSALTTVPAVKAGRVIVFADRAVVTPGPRLGAVVKRIAAALHPK